MVRLATASPYVLEYQPRRLIHTTAGIPVAWVDQILWIAPGYGIYPIGAGVSGMAAAIPETPVHPRMAITDGASVIAVVEGVGQVFPGYLVRPVTATEAALTSDR